MEFLKNYQDTLFPYAYNILGTSDDAMDVVQDVVMSHLSNQKTGIENESAYLIKSVINRSINLKIRSKKMVGEATWLPEPIATENADKKINSQEILSYSLLVLMEYLNPQERAVFILKEAFDYSHQEIAEIFSFTVENSRKLLSRAKKTLKEKGSDYNSNSIPGTNFLTEYIDVIRNGNVEMLEQMLAEQITAQTDGGGKVKVLSEFTSGIKAVARFAIKVYDLYLKNYQVKFRNLNHTPSLLFYKGSILISCQIFDRDTATGKINNIYSVVDPEKLKGIEKN
jgi:RNA polymerase sigma-70 factor (ECF subfamily)